MAGDEFATRFAERVLAARWPVILTTLLLVAVASGGIARLEFSANYRIFFDDDNPELSWRSKRWRIPTGRTRTSPS